MLEYMYINEEPCVDLHFYSGGLGISVVTYNISQEHGVMRK